MRVVLRFALLAPFLLTLGGCFSFLGFGNVEDSVPPAERQLPASTQALLAIKGMKQESPIFVRIFKEESEFEVWKFKDGRFQHFRTYPICAWSGGLGPKVQQGDRQAPEGFYTVSRAQMNPHSLYHLAFNIGFPNAYDAANGHTGSSLMVHGDCKSAGCYAMTDAYIEEIYILAREAFNAGQTKFHVQALPFHMTAENMRRHRDSPWYPFWLKLKEGYDSFEATGKPPIVKVCSKQYLVNVSFPGRSSDPAPNEMCPAYAKLDPKSIQGIDGVPPTVLASLSKSEQGARAPAQPPVMMAASVQAAPGNSLAAPAPLVDMSASAVITRPAPKPSLIASTQTPKAPASPVYAKPSVGQTASAQARATGTVSQPVSYQIGSALASPAKAAPPVGAAPGGQTYELDADGALQKLNRSGKGNMLPSSYDQQTSALAIGDGQPAP
ncbi:MAG: L,D-transpeptidase family protein, partial [Rhodomicrobium sp.]